MSIKLYGNQHGTFVKADGHHLTFIKLVASREGITEEAALNRILQDHIDRELSK